MTPALTERILAAIADATVPAATVPDATVETDFGQVTVWLPREHWLAAARVVRTDPQIAADWLDLLTGWDELSVGEPEPSGFVVVLQVMSLAHRHRVRLATRVPRSDPTLASLTAVYPGVDWHERETAEMFGLSFAGHPNPMPLLLPDAVRASGAPHPLRKNVVLAARQARPWPGEVEP